MACWPLSFWYNLLPLHLPDVRSTRLLICIVHLIFQNEVCGGPAGFDIAIFSCRLFICRSICPTRTVSNLPKQCQTYPPLSLNPPKNVFRLLLAMSSFGFHRIRQLRLFLQAVLQPFDSTACPFKYRWYPPCYRSSFLSLT